MKQLHSFLVYFITSKMFVTGMSTDALIGSTVNTETIVGNLT